MSAEAEAAEVDARRHIVAGRWHPGGWTSVYVRANVPVGPGSWNLRLEVFMPKDVKKPPELLVRLGTRALTSLDRIEPGKLLRHEVRLPDNPEAAVLPISIRASHAYRAVGGDARPLGVVLKSWLVVPCASGESG